MANVFWVPESARWESIRNQAKQPDIGKRTGEEGGGKVAPSIERQHLCWLNSHPVVMQAFVWVIFLVTQVTKWVVLGPSCCLLIVYSIV